MKPVRVLIVDDMTLIRQGVRSLLKDRDAIEIVGEAADADEAFALARELRPDAVLLDQDVPGLNTTEAIGLLKHEKGDLEVVVMSDHPETDAVFQALEAGASAYVLKDITADNLVKAVHGVCNGRTLMHPNFTRELVERFRAMTRQQNGQRAGARLNGLTNRELEIIIEMADGATDREIAEKTRLAESTVKSHIRSILRKIGARNRTQAVAFIIRKGLVR